MEEHAKHHKIAGLDLRYVLTWQLIEADSVLPVSALARRLEADGFGVARPASKTVSDALRWEVGRGRVVRVGRGSYRPGTMPRQTRSRIRLRVAALRREAAPSHDAPTALVTR